MNDVTGLVAGQFESYPHPDPAQDISGADHIGEPHRYSALLWPEGRPREDLRILVAGCGANEAAVIASINPGCAVLGIDLSQASLAHEGALKSRHRLDNLTLERADLRAASALGKTFDLIFCGNVLNHLEDPGEGLRALAGALDPLGAMVVTLNGAGRRVGVEILQDVFRRLRLGQDAAGIAMVKATLAALPPQHHAHWFVRGNTALDADSAVVNTFLPTRDRSWWVPELLRLVEGSGLVFQGWCDNAAYHPIGLPAGELRGAIEALPLAEQWAIMEKLSVQIGSHRLVACRPERAATGWRITFDDDEWRGYYPVRNPRCRTERPWDGGAKGGAYRRGTLALELSAPESLLFASADGTSRTCDVLAHQAFGAISLDARLAFGHAFYARMWRLGHMYFSKVQRDPPAGKPSSGEAPPEGVPTPSSFETPPAPSPSC